MVLSFVCCRNSLNMNDNILTLFRTYSSVENVRANDDCAIWQAARATSATPGLFERILIGRGRQPYIDGGLGCNNPTKLVLQEATQLASLLPTSNKVVCVISIGNGRPRPISLPVDGSMLYTFMQIAKDCGAVHDEMVGRFAQNSDVYFRFNVEQGMQMLQDELVKKSADVEAHTDSYLKGTDTRQLLFAAARALVKREGKLHIDSPRMLYDAFFQ